MDFRLQAIAHHWKNHRLAICFDLSMIPIAWMGAWMLHFDLKSFMTFYASFAIAMLPSLFLVQSFAYMLTRLYRSVWRFASLPDLFRISKAIILGILGLLGIFILQGKLSMLICLSYLGHIN